jgi:hypothetical protein
MTFPVWLLLVFVVILGLFWVAVGFCAMMTAVLTKHVHDLREQVKAVELRVEDVSMIPDPNEPREI